MGTSERSGTLVIMESVARHVFVIGRVQGVAFRWHAKERAQGLGLCGWVRNLDDGRVEAWIEGAQAEVELMLVWLQRGPPGSRVSGVKVHPVAPAGHAGVELTRA